MMKVDYQIDKATLKLHLEISNEQQQQLEFSIHVTHQARPKASHILLSESDARLLFKSKKVS